MCSPSPPPPPDYAGAAAAQGQANLDAARVQGRINNPNVVNPYGRQTVTWEGDNPTLTQTLSPEEQHLLEQRWRTRDLLGQLGIQGADSLFGIVGKPIDYSGAPGAPGTYTPDGRLVPLDLNSLPGRPDPYNAPTNLPDVQASEEVRKRVIEAMMGRSNEAIDKRQENTEAELIARGLHPGTEAYAREEDALNRQRNDARMQAEIAGGDAAAQAFGMDLSRRQQFQNEALQNSALGFNQRMGLRGQALGEQGQFFDQSGRSSELFQRQQGQQFSQGSESRRQAIAEMLTRRQTPLNEIIALLSGTQVNNPFSIPSFNAGANVAPPPIFGAADAQSRYGTDIYNSQVGTANANTSAAANIAAAYLAYAF